eukprot:6491184-Amphidinium_carterae.1
MTSLAQWRAAGEHPQLQAAESVMLRLWVCPRPVIAEDTEAPPCHTEIRVFAIHFPGAPGDVVDYILACVPATAILNQDYVLTRLAVHCYGEGGPLDQVDTVDVAVLLLPGTYLYEALGESVPASSTMLAFSDLSSGASPSPADLFAACDIPAEFSDGVTAHLELGEDMMLGLHLTSLADGEDEVFASAGEEVGEDPRRLLSAHPLPVAVPHAHALSKAKAKGAPARRTAAKPKPSAASQSSLLNAPSVLPSRPRNMAELSATLAPVLDTIVSRLAQLEQAQQSSTLAVSPAAVPMASPPQGRGSQAPMPSLLSPSRCLPGMVQPPGLGRPSAGPRAYQESVAEARRLLTPGVPLGGLAEGVSTGRARQADSALRMAVEQGGSQANMALQLAMVDALERLGGLPAAASGHAEREPRTLEDFLLGVGGGHLGEEKASMAFGGAKGMANMQRLARSIEENPSQWSESFDTAIWRALSCDVTGAPWSLQRYGQERLKWGKHTDLQRFFWMVSALHALHRSGQMELLGAKLGQFAKAIEVTLLMQGHWSVAWQLTGIAEPLPHSALHAGLAHPTELSSSLAYLKE